MVEPVFESPLAEMVERDGLYVDIREIATRGMIDLRGVSSDRKFNGAAKTVLGFDLPKQPRSSVAFGDIKALWLSPDQWLILCTREKASTLVAELLAALAKTHVSVVDVSDMRAVIRIEGKRTREVLMKCGSLDLMGKEYGPGTARRMRFAEIPALINVIEADVIDLYVFRSQANYAWDFLYKAARMGSEVRAFEQS